MLTNLIHVVLNSTPRSTAIKRNMFRNLLFFTAFILLLVLTASAHGGGSDHDDDDDNKEAAAAAKPDLRSKSLILVKILCFVFIFVGTFVGGVSPYFLNWNEEFLVLGGQFAGGVFLGTAMMHFLRDANETFQDLTTIEYPFAFMLACAGYLLVMLADCVISYIYRKQRNFDLESQGRNKDAKDEMGHSKSGSSVTSLVDSILLIAALCFHSVFEGIAIGIADCTADAWKALWTISIHKIFAAMALVIALLKMIPDRAFISCAAYVFAFGISSPIGVGIGILIDDTKEGRVADWIFAISMGIACGVFVYVSINRLLRGYNQTPKPTSVGTPHHKLLAVMMGIGVIAVVMIWDN